MTKLYVTTNRGSLFIGDRRQTEKGIEGQYWATIPEGWLQPEAVKVERAELLAMAPELRAALQWLLDDMTDAGEATSETGEVFDSVAFARDILSKAGGHVHN